MSLCIQIDSNNNISATNQTIENCNDYVLMSSSDYTNYMLLENIFAIPDQQNLIELFMFVFTNGLMLFFIAWAVGKVATIAKTF